MSYEPGTEEYQIVEAISQKIGNAVLVAMGEVNSIDSVVVSAQFEILFDNRVIESLGEYIRTTTDPFSAQFLLPIEYIQEG